MFSVCRVENSLEKAVRLRMDSLSSPPLTGSDPPPGRAEADPAEGGDDGRRGGEVALGTHTRFFFSPFFFFFDYTVISTSFFMSNLITPCQYSTLG